MEVIKYDDVNQYNSILYELKNILMLKIIYR